MAHPGYFSLDPMPNSAIVTKLSQNLLEYKSILVRRTTVRILYLQYYNFTFAPLRKNGTNHLSKVEFLSSCYPLYHISTVHCAISSTSRYEPWHKRKFFSFLLI